MKNIKLKIISSVMIITLITGLFAGCGSPEPSGTGQSLAEIVENDKTTGATEVKETEKRTEKETEKVKETEKETESGTESETEGETEPETATRKQQSEEQTAPDETEKETQKEETESSAPGQDGFGQATQPESKPTQDKPQATQPEQNKPQATQPEPVTVIIKNDEPKIPEAYWDNYSYNCAVMYAYDTGDLSVLNKYDKAVYDVLTKKAAEIKNKYSSAYEREKACHDWVCDVTTYDHKACEAIENDAEGVGHKWGEWPTNEYADKRGHGQTSYECIIYGKCVCNGYAVTMQALLTMAGVENKYVSGILSGEPHAWNEVKLDGEWYVVDVTWDDGTLRDGTENTGYDRYGYFNIQGDDYARGYSGSAKTNSGKYSYYNQVITKLDNFRATADEVTEYIRQCLESRSESIEVYYPADIGYEFPNLGDICPYYSHLTEAPFEGRAARGGRYLTISGIVYYDEPAVDLSQITVIETQDELSAALNAVYGSDSYKSGDVVLIWTKWNSGLVYTINKDWEISADSNDIINDNLAYRLGISCVKLIKK